MRMRIAHTVDFASVGTPAGGCGNFSRDAACDGHAANAVAYVSKQCLGRARCTLEADIATFNHGVDPCAGKVRPARTL